MTHQEHARIGNGLDNRFNPLATFEFDAVDTRLLEAARRIAHCILPPARVGTERRISDSERVGGAAPNRFGMAKRPSLFFSIAVSFSIFDGLGNWENRFSYPPLKNVVIIRELNHIPPGRPCAGSVQAANPF
jgi:hypothetical protein